MTAAQQPDRLGHVPALDGLRAIAIAGVVLFHMDFAPGGWNGVTLFFVVSGFLITTLLRQEKDRTGSIALGAFYLRRLGRLYPALVLAVIVGIPLALYVHIPARYVIGGAAATLLYSMNIVDATLNPTDFDFFGWSWSLSLEEQFYFIWPPLLRKLDVDRHRARIAAGLVVVGVASTAARIVIAPRNLNLAYLAPYTKLDALIAGVLIALFPASRSLGRSRGGQYWGWLGIAGAIVAYFVGTTSANWVGWGEVMFVGFALLMVLAALGPANAYTRLLGSRPFVFLGRISYGLYVWHDILGRFAVYHRTNSVRVRVAVLVVSIGVATASTLLLEEPLRRRIRAWTARGRTARPTRTAAR